MSWRCLLGWHQYSDQQELIDDPQIGYMVVRECVRCGDLEFVTVPGELLIGDKADPDDPRERKLGPWDDVDWENAT